jgi:hypothetical protein
MSLFAGDISLSTAALAFEKIIGLLDNRLEREPIFIDPERKACI